LRFSGSANAAGPDGSINPGTEPSARGESWVGRAPSSFNDFGTDRGTGRRRFEVASPFDSCALTISAGVTNPTTINDANTIRTLDKRTD